MDGWGSTPTQEHSPLDTLEDYVLNKNVDGIKTVIQNNPDVFKGKKEECRLLLQNAVLVGDPDVLNALLEGGANSECDWVKNVDWNDVFCGGDNIPIVKILVKMGADINKKGRFGFTPLHSAAEQGRASVVKAFIKLGADVNTTGDDMYTPLHSAASMGHFLVVKLLVENGADINAKNYQGYTALHFANSQPYPAIVAYLIKHGAKVTITDKPLPKEEKPALSFNMQEKPKFDFGIPAELEAITVPIDWKPSDGFSSGWGPSGDSTLTWNSAIQDSKRSDAAQKHKHFIHLLKRDIQHSFDELNGYDAEDIAEDILDAILSLD